ncbi:MAG: hypothetical protein KC464_13310 [Myxococcales bacterium]|nr:hypothetical protein [Myxococcales bacterium]
MPRPVSNPPNPWASTHVEWLEPPPAAALEIYEEEAKSILSSNDSPDLDFRWSVNPYRGCFHACAYCVAGDTPILMADGRTRPIRELRVGDDIVGTVVRGRYRRFTTTQVLAHWPTVKEAYRVTLTDGTTLVASGDHRFLTRRGWKHVVDDPRPGGQRPHLTTNDQLLGFGALGTPKPPCDDYRRGYLCGMIRGDGLLRSYHYDGRRRARDRVHQFRLALIDLEALRRTRAYLDHFGVSTHEAAFRVAAGYRPMRAVRTSARPQVDRVRELVAWPASPTAGWERGFLAGVFDAEGSHSRGVLRISNTDDAMIDRTEAALRRLGCDVVVERRDRERPIAAVRVRASARDRQRLLTTIDPAISRKRSIDGLALEGRDPLRVAEVTSLGVDLLMYDITTGTEDFVADGVIAHNCYARPSHQYLGFGAGTDFDRKIVVKTNAAALLRAAFGKPSWRGESITFSGNTDCYQPLEASYGLTRACLEVCAEYRNPVSIITKSMVVRRDVDLLARLARDARAMAWLSIPFARDDLARKIEPFASPPSRRFETLRALADAGVPTGIGIAPVIPGLNDADLPELLERARDAGAAHAFLILLRLPAEVLPVFRERVAEVLAPERVRRVEHALIELRGGSGKLDEAAFHARHRGVGERWRAIEQLFELHRRRLGLGDGPTHDGATTFRRPTRQLDLFA